VVVEEFLEVTVIICTRNRAKQLASVLESATALRVPEGLQWEFLLVDNGSTDNTAEVAMTFADRLPMRVVREDTPGLSNARNKGVSEARGRYLCWTDDDVVIDPGWLAAYVEAFRKHPDAAIFGGRVLPRLEGGGAPSWFVEHYLAPPIASPMAYRDLGDAELALNSIGNLVPYGANFALRTAEQRQALYDPELGVSPMHKRLGEEVDVIHRMMTAGASGWWVPNSIVNHIIPPARQTAAYIFEYYFLAGATAAHLHSNRPADNHLAAKGHTPLPRWRSYRRALRRLASYVWKRRGDDIRWISALADLGYYLGMGSYRSPLEKHLIALKHHFK
jgi:glucosyl-dolichyl phosphate glucuronosyltransferase